MKWPLFLDSVTNRYMVHYDDKHMLVFHLVWSRNKFMYKVKRSTIYKLLLITDETVPNLMEKVSDRSFIYFVLSF